MVSVRQSRLDEIIDASLATLASGDATAIGGLVRTLAARWPDEPALAICFALTSAAFQLEEQFADQKTSSQLAYRIAALLAADVFALESMGQIPTKGHHLLKLWRREDPYFIEL